MQTTVVDNLDDLQSSLRELAKTGQRIALVPTMGALHKGHMELVEAAKKYADIIVVSVFVNPKQFSAGEDLKEYPRDLDADIAKLKEAEATVVYTPSEEDMYPAGFATVISPGGIGEGLCAATRPDFFNGISTVVTKLLLRILPHVVLFGEKDYQQLCVVNQIVYDLDIPIGVIGVPTVREEDGLAMASRNVYLNSEERKIAPQLYAQLKEAAQEIKSGEGDLKSILMVAGTKLTQLGFAVEYLELRADGTLYSLDNYEPNCRLLVAAKLGSTRLIDNIKIE